MDANTESYIDRLSEQLVKRNIDDPKQLNFRLEKLFDNSPATCTVTHYNSPEDIEQLVLAIRHIDQTISNSEIIAS